MQQINHTGLISGLNELGQIEMSVKAAQKMVGSATMQQDPRGPSACGKCDKGCKGYNESCTSNRC